MKQKEEHLPVGDMAEQPKPIEEQANPSVAIPQETVKTSVAGLSPEMLQKVITAAILEANCTQKKEQENSVDQDTQSGQKGAFRGNVDIYFVRRDECERQEKKNNCSRHRAAFCYNLICVQYSGKKTGGRSLVLRRIDARD